MKNKLPHARKGMILSEILLAGAVISFALASVVIVIGGLQSMLINVQNGFEASLIAGEEIARAHLTNFNEIVPFEKNNGIFTTVFSVSYRNSFSTNISADVFWYEGSFRKHRILMDQIVDWKHAFGAEDCDWLDNAEGNLTAVNFGVLNADNNNNPITDVAVFGDYVYVSADSTVASSSDLYVIDVHDIQNPKIIGRLNTGPGIASISAAGHYIFAANAGSYQMQIINVADPANPFLVAQAKLPGAIISGSAGYGQSMHFFDNKIYIGLVKNAGPEFHIVDVTNPTAPIALGSYEIGSTVNDIDAQIDRAVVVTPGQNSVFLFDTSDPTAISEISHISLDGWQTQGAKSVEMLGTTIAVGRTLGGFYSPQPEYLTLSRDLLSSTTLMSSLKIGASVTELFGFNNYLYMATSDADRAFQILRNSALNGAADDASGNGVGGATSSPVVTMSAALSSRGVALTCNNKAMYVVTQNDQDFFHVFSLP